MIKDVDLIGMFVILAVVVAYFAWPRPKFQLTWNRMKNDLLDKACHFNCLMGARTIAETIWLLEEMGKRTDHEIRRILVRPDGKLDKHTWWLLHTRPKKLSVLLDRIQKEGYSSLRELEMNQFRSVVINIWRSITGQSEAHEAFETASSRAVSNAGTLWLNGLSAFGSGYDMPSFASRTLALSVSGKRDMLYSLKRHQQVLTGALLWIESQIYRVTGVYWVAQQGQGTVEYELYCLATGEMHYLSLPNPLDLSRCYISISLKCATLQLEDSMPEQITIGDYRDFVLDASQAERIYTKIEESHTIISDGSSMNTLRVTRWAADDRRVSCFVIGERRVAFMERRLKTAEDALPIMVAVPSTSTTDY